MFWNVIPATALFSSITSRERGAFRIGTQKNMDNILVYFNLQKFYYHSHLIVTYQNETYLFVCLEDEARIHLHDCPKRWKNSVPIAGSLVIAISLLRSSNSSFCFSRVSRCTLCSSTTRLCICSSACSIPWIISE